MANEPRRLLFARHGLTQWNLAGRVQGLADIPLCPEGEQQAVQMGRDLAGERLRRIYHSPLGRTTRTAQLIAAFQPGMPSTMPAFGAGIRTGGIHGRKTSGIFSPGYRAFLKHCGRAKAPCCWWPTAG